MKLLTKLFISCVIMTLTISTAYAQLPPQVVLLSPPNGAGNVSTTPLFIWQSVNDKCVSCISYHLQVALLSDLFFQFPVIDVEKIAVPKYKTTPEQQLLPLVIYHWRVRAKNSAGYGPWESIPFYFTTGS